MDRLVYTFSMIVQEYNNFISGILTIGILCVHACMGATIITVCIFAWAGSLYVVNTHASYSYSPLMTSIIQKVGLHECPSIRINCIMHVAVNRLLCIEERVQAKRSQGKLIAWIIIIIIHDTTWMSVLFLIWHVCWLALVFEYGISPCQLQPSALSHPVCTYTCSSDANYIACTLC